MASREEEIAAFRAAAQQLTDDTSLRQAAQEIGLSWSGLRTFLAGTNPYGPTLKKLREWYWRTHEDEIVRLRRRVRDLEREVESLREEMEGLRGHDV